MQFNFSISDIPGIIKRRFFWGAIPFLLVALTTVLIIKAMPPIYESSATLIVVDQQIRNEYVRSAVTSNVLQRIETISAQVKARDSLLDIADELRLFEGSDVTSATERSEIMSDRLTIFARRTASTGRSNDASAITVKIAFRSPRPNEARRVTNRILTEFSNLSVEQRTEIASETSDFLGEEEARISAALDSVTRQINVIKEENADSLPENRAIYERALDRATAEATRLDSDLQDTRQRIRLLELQRPILTRDDSQMSPQEQELARLRRALEQLRSSYQDTYPDVIAMKQEVLSLEYDIDPAAFKRRATSEVKLLGELIDDAEDSGQDARRLTALRDDLREKLKNLPASQASESMSVLQFNAQLATLKDREETLLSGLDENSLRISELENQISATPVVASQLLRLEDERLQLQNDLSRLRTNLSEAQRSQNLEQQAKAERLTVIEQPRLPDAPISPNKPQLAVLGFGAAGLIAALMALVPEVLFARVYRRHHLEAVLPNTRIIEVPNYKSTTLSPKSLLIFGGLSLLTIGLLAVLGWTALGTLV